MSVPNHSISVCILNSSTYTTPEPGELPSTDGHSRRFQQQQQQQQQQATIIIRLTMTRPVLPPPESTSVQVFGRGNIHICRQGQQNSVLIVSLWRPHVKNAFHDDLYLDLIDVLASVTADRTVSAIVLTGTGHYFSSGADLKNGSFLPEEENDRGRDTVHKPAGRFMMALLAFPKIIAAAVQGPAVGIGVTLLLHCDLVYCTERSTFWAPFTRLALGECVCPCVCVCMRERPALTIVVYKPNRCQDHDNQDTYISRLSMNLLFVSIPIVFFSILSTHSLTYICI